jgi:hypothetical protein
MISSIELFRIDLNDFLKVFFVCKALRTETPQLQLPDLLHSPERTLAGS